VAATRKTATPAIEVQAVPPTTAPVIQIAKINATHMLVPIVGTAPLLVHRFSEKAKRKMLDAQQGKKNVKEFRDPQSEYEASMYRLDNDRYGFPSVAFKSCTVGAARFYGKDVRMTDLRQCLFFRGEVSKQDGQMMAEIVGEPRMREDVVRLSISSTDLRYRAEFVEWSATLDVIFVSTAISQDSVLSLIDAGGMGVGVGEWRPEKSGANGTFMLDSSREVEIIG
jgi:hypothetical protein